MAAASLTKPSTPRLSESARHLVIPDGICTTGWPAVEARGLELGIGYDEWQVGAGRIILGKREDGIYAASIGGVVFSIPRQVGKTYFVGSLLMILCVLFPGFKVIWTAHRTRTATSAFRSMQVMAKRKKFWPHILAIRTANGEQEISFRNGSLIMFGAREQGFGRGHDEIDAEVFDEAQILTEKALEDMVAATNQARHPHGALLFYIGTPPRPIDPGEVFTNKRTKAIAGQSKDTVYVEFSADPKADPDDRAQWEIANPSFPKRTPLVSMLRLRENLGSDEAWLREGLGVWDPEANLGGGVNLAKWRALVSDRIGAPIIEAFGIDADPDLSSAVITAAGTGRDDGRVWLEALDEEDPKSGVAWLVPRCIEVAANSGTSLFAVQKDGSLADLIPALREAGLNVVELDTNDVRQACAGIVTAVNDEGSIAHMLLPEGRQSRTDAAIQAAKVLHLENGSFVFARKKSTAPIHALYSATFALYAATRASDRAPINNVW